MKLVMKRVSNLHHESDLDRWLSFRIEGSSFAFIELRLLYRVQIQYQV